MFYYNNPFDVWPKSLFNDRPAAVVSAQIRVAGSIPDTLEFKESIYLIIKRLSDY